MKEIQISVRWVIPSQHQDTRNGENIQVRMNHLLVDLLCYLMNERDVAGIDEYHITSAVTRSFDRNKWNLKNFHSILHVQFCLSYVTERPSIEGHFINTAFSLQESIFFHFRNATCYHERL